jgi:hypothetical protein
MWDALRVCLGTLVDGKWDPIASLGDALFYFGYVAKGAYITNALCNP